MKPLYTITTLIFAVIVATRLSLPWYIGLFFVWGATDFVSSLYNAIQKTNREFRI